MAKLQHLLALCALLVCGFNTVDAVRGWLRVYLTSLLLQATPYNKLNATVNNLQSLWTQRNA